MNSIPALSTLRSPRFAWAETLAQCEIVSSELRRDMGYYAGAAAAMYFLLGKRA